MAGVQRERGSQGSLCEALLDGDFREEGRELLDDAVVQLGAEGHVQQQQLGTRLQQLLQGLWTHHPGAWTVNTG